MAPAPATVSSQSPKVLPSGSPSPPGPKMAGPSSEPDYHVIMELVQKWLAKGMPIQEIAALLDTRVQEVRRLSKNGRR